MFRGTQYFSQFGCTDHFPPHLHHNLFNRLHGDGQPPSSCPRGRLCPYSHDEATALLAASKGVVAIEELPQAAPPTTAPAPAPLAPAPVPSAYSLPSQQPLGPPPLAPPPSGNSVDLARVLAQALAGAGGLPLPYQSLGAAPPQPLPPSSYSSSSSSTSSSYGARPQPQPQPQPQQPPFSSASSSADGSVGGPYQARPPQPSTGSYNPHASLVATLTAMSARLSSSSSSATSPAPMDVSAATYEQQPTTSAPSVKKPLLLGRRREGLRGLSALRGTGAKSSLPSMSLALPKKKPASRPEPKNLVSAKPAASEGGPQRATQGPTTGLKQAARAPPQAGDKRKLEAPARTAPPSAQPRSRTPAQSLVAATAATSPPAGSVKRARVEPIAPIDEYDPLLPMSSFGSPLNLSGDDDDDDDDDDVLLLEAKAKKAAAVAPPSRQLLKRAPAPATTTTTTTTKTMMTSSARPAGAPGAQRVAGQSRPTLAAGQMPGFYRKRPAEPDDAPPERALEVKGAQLQLAVEKHKRLMAQRAGQGSSSTAQASSSTGSHPPRPSGSQLYAPVLPSSLSVAPSSLPYAFSTSSTASSSFAPAYSSSSSSLAPTLPTSTSAIAKPSVNRSALSSSSGSTRLAKLRKDMPVLVRPAPARTPSAAAPTTTAATSAASLAPAPTGGQQQRQRQPTATDKQRAMLDQRRKHLEDKQRQRDEAEKRRHQSTAHAARQAASLGLGPAHSANAVAGAPQQQQVVMGGGGGAEEEDEMEEVEYRELQGKPRDIVPAPRYPTVAFDLKPKVPRAVRQAVLDKFLEETLRKHHFLHFALDSCAGQPDDAWMQTAIDEAVRLETEQYQKCQSKGVYVNLCAKAMQVLKRGE